MSDDDGVDGDWVGSEERGAVGVARVGWGGPHLFDLDGVLTDSAVVHADAWAKVLDEVLVSPLADRCALVDRRPFDSDDYLEHIDGRPRRVAVIEFLASRGAQRDWLIQGGGAAVVDEIAENKDDCFREQVETGGVGVFDDVVPFLQAVGAVGLGRAVVSSSRNARLVLESSGLDAMVDVVVDGVVAASEGLAGKPAPDPFIFAAGLFGAPPDACEVLEDAVSGVLAGRSGGFGRVVGVDRIGRPHRLRTAGADLVVSRLTDLIAS